MSGDFDTYPDVRPKSDVRLGRRTPPKIRLVRSAGQGLIGATLIKRFRVESLVGTGGMGTVYAASEIATGREVAIKVLNPEAFTSANLRRFRREARAATSLKHPNVCQVHCLGVGHGTPFIVMERLEGETLRRRLRDTGPVAIADAVSIMMQLLDALAAAHNSGVIHRDVKPGNVFLTSPRGRSVQIKLIDFGLARALPTIGWSPQQLPPSPGVDDEQSSITETDMIPGTPFYLTPEQLAGSKDLDERVDVWAAGLTMFEMLVGRRAFFGDNFGALARTIVLAPSPSMRLLRADVPEEIDRVLQRALAKRREDRFRSALEFRDALVTAWARHRVDGLGRAEALRAHSRAR